MVIIWDLLSVRPDFQTTSPLRVQATLSLYEKTIINSFTPLVAVKFDKVQFQELSFQLLTGGCTGEL